MSNSVGLRSPGAKAARLEQRKPTKGAEKYNAVSRRAAQFQVFIVPILILLLAAGLRFHGLARDTRFHPDEALFATFARAAALNGRWLLPGPLDKPPLSLYAEALAMIPFVDASNPNLLQLDLYLGEFAARLPSTFASIALVAVTYALASTLYQERTTALVGMLLMALSPFAIAFGATAFTDGVMLLWITSSVLAAAKGKWTTAGVCLALGVACKFQALLYLPLVVAAGWVMTTRMRVRFLISLALPLAIVALALALWDQSRAQLTGLWALNAANNDPGRLIWLDELTPRLHVWLAHGAMLLGLPIVTAALVALSLVAGLWRWNRRQRASAIDGILLMFVIGYLLLHWLVALNTYDRYLLPLLPILVILAARGITWASAVILSSGLRDSGFRTKDLGLRKSAPGIQHDEVTTLGEASLAPTTPHSHLGDVLIVGLMGIILFPAAVGSSNGDVPVGGDRGEHEGIDGLANWLNGRTLGAIVYDRWLGWELGYYLGEWTDKRRVYYPTPGVLADDALLQPDPAPRYFVAPADESLIDWLNALRQAGFRVSLAYEYGNFVVYQLMPPWATDP